MVPVFPAGTCLALKMYFKYVINVDVVLSLTRGYNLVRSRRTGSSTSGVEEHLERIHVVEEHLERINVTVVAAIVVLTSTFITG